MSQKQNQPESPLDGKEATRVLSAAAKRALAEAEQRRKSADSKSPVSAEKEIGGRKGPDPVRFGDWENGGIVSDF